MARARSFGRNLVERLGHRDRAEGAILVVDEFIDLVFTRGMYGVLPMQGVSLNFSKLSTL
ncbi:MAG: hypothetical protein R3C10_07830 [Pirellulales bacterium]